ncbi:MAG: GNAT family N-acetyltransferase [Anaerolineaceae bacterium]|nr:GNAT family N-acetyltransferase [Anaerolineaceae bacterium]
MAKKPIQPDELSFRPATEADAKVASALIYATFPQVATFTIGLGSEDRAKAILERVFIIPGHRLSYEEMTLAVVQGRVVGGLMAYSAKRLPKLDRVTDRLILKQYKFRGKLAVIIRTWPLVFMKDAKRRDYVIGNLAVRPQYRGRGLGQQLLKHAEIQAKEAGLRRLALRVAIENKPAKKLYDDFGFKTTAMFLESNVRVKMAGAGYRWMVKELSA